jgi:PUA domain protein
MRKHLSKSDIRKLNESISYLDFEINKKSKVELLDDKVIIIDNKPSFFYYKKRISPTLQFILENPDYLSKVIVDMGAIRFVANGADIMRPGIKSCDEFIEDDLVVVIDETHHKPLAVGVALFDSETMMSEDSGRVIMNIHRVGDEIWTIK